MVGIKTFEQQILSLSSDVLAAADAGDWERLAVLQDDRLAALQRLMLSAEKHLPAIELHHLIHVAREEDQRLKAAVTSGQQTLKQQLAETKKNRKAINKYQTSSKS